MAGRTTPEHSPNPMRMLSFWQKPRIITSSPSAKNLRVSLFFSGIDFVPFQLSSSIDPYESGVSPLMVPDANTSPGFKLQPVTV